MSTAMLIEKTDTGVPLALTIDQSGIGGLTGQAPTVAIRRGDSTTLYLDWTTGLFAAAGWGTKFASMTEIERGHYVRILNAATAAGILAGQSLVVEYRVDNGAGIIGDAHDLITVVTALYNISAAAGGLDVDQQVAAHQIPGSFGELLYQVRIEEEEDDFTGEGF